MFISIPTEYDLSEDNIAREVGKNLFSAEQAHSAVFTGDYEPLTVALEKSLSLKANINGTVENFHYKHFIAARDFAFKGKFTTDLGNMHDQIGLTMLGQSTTDLYSGAGLTNACYAILCGFFARIKLELAKETIDADTLCDLYTCSEFCLGGRYKGFLLGELALLADMSLQAVKNSLSKPGAPKTRYEFKRADENRGDIPHLVTVDALEGYEWLKQRRGFIDTYEVSGGEPDLQSSALLVPQAKDGSVFDAKCRMGKGYKIGKKGEELYVENFTDALQALRNMPKAYWRRPSPTSGVSGIVSAATWVSRTPAELGIGQ